MSLTIERVLHPVKKVIIFVLAWVLFMGIGHLIFWGTAAFCRNDMLIFAREALELLYYRDPAWESILFDWIPGILTALIVFLPNKLTFTNGIIAGVILIISHLTAYAIYGFIN